MNKTIPKLEAMDDFCTLDYKLQLCRSAAKGAWTGARYIESLKDGRQVWYDGEVIDVTRHPSFQGLLMALAELYDKQRLENNSADMLTELDDGSLQVSASYIVPSTREELDKKWRNSHKWMQLSYGQLPRVPDFMANVVVGLYDFRHELGKVDPQFEKNAEDYYHYCREHDICLTHALGDPQIDRSASPVENPDHALRVVKRTKEGIVVHGAKQLATLAPYCHEALIYLSPAFYMRESPEFVAWFSVPMNAPGLKFLCRESHVGTSNGFRHAFSQSYDEQDSMLFFDHVFIPMNRVFLLENTEVAAKGFHELNKWSLYVGQIRFYHRLRTFLGVTSLVAKSIGVDGFREIMNRVGELTSYVELVRSCLVGIDSETRISSAGNIAPGSTLALDSFASQIAPRINEILRDIGGSGIIMQPSAKDLANPELRPYLEKYMKGKGVDVDFKTDLFRLAFELIGDRFGARQELYEIWNRGDIVRTRMALCKSYPDLNNCEEEIKDLIKELK
ncbi:4-hydroxyphenylacetate 3-hydroxylase N-terminal domain-containing protein [Shewanella woodyi]|uniref:4-hydroxyphenylacetate 3-hydroxylase n=1 Tax=Shewanella woodyi (strain ATCC 51908 / MS32) TaxID=392500 RepID=B1KR96_SHEWM|nr:4-hydroxyphenylacetate 3-hydroxylase N-terminal domain-containing protein [Shewanella woodyi]ACA86303.1 4-hydroxyphenylacetate 3-hydroxylase [Shewanella woodyi ATCC 51908]